MEEAGFGRVGIADATAEFLETARAWLTEFSRHESDVKGIIGEAEWEERQASRRQLLMGIEIGLLRRVLVNGRVGG